MPTDEDFRWLAQQWYMNRAQRIILLSNSKGRRRKKPLTVEPVKGT